MYTNAIVLIYISIEQKICIDLKIVEIENI